MQHIAGAGTNMTTMTSQSPGVYVCMSVCTYVGKYVSLYVSMVYVSIRYRYSLPRVSEQKIFDKRKITYHRHQGDNKHDKLTWVWDDPKTRH